MSCSPDETVFAAKVKDDSPVSTATEVTLENKRISKEDIYVPKKDHYFAMFTFCMIGTIQLLVWNMFIQAAGAMNTIVWPDTTFLDLLGGTEHAAAWVISILMIKYDGLHVNGCQFWTLINTVCFILLPLVPQFLHGSSNYNVALPLLIVLSLFLGLCAGMMHVYGYAFASILPSNYVGWVSTGNGVAGFYAFVVYLLLSEAAFDKSLHGRLGMLWVYFLTGAVLSVVQLVAFWILSRKPWFQECVKIAKNRKEEDMEAVLAQWGPRRSLWAVLKDCWLQAFNSAFTLFVTLLCFPVCGPYGWGKSDTHATLLNGTFQTLDLVLRWLPNVGGWTMIPKKILFVCVVLRPLVFVPLFMIPNRLPDVPFFSSIPWLYILMAIFTISSGWFVTLGAMYCPETVEHPAEKELASEIFVVIFLGFIMAGIYASKLLLL